MRPLLNEELFALGEWMAKTCIVPMISCFQCMLPAKLKPKSTHGHARGNLDTLCEDGDGLTVKQRAALQALQEERKCFAHSFIRFIKHLVKSW